MATLNKDGTERRAPFTWLQAENLYLKGGAGKTGCAVLSEKLVEHSAPVDLLDSLIEDLSGEDHDCSDLVALREMFANRRSQGQRGRKPAQAGDTRAYTGQQITIDGEPGEVFLKIPVTVLGVVKHGKANVRFSDDQIVIERLPEGTPAPDADDDQ